MSAGNFSHRGVNRDMMVLAPKFRLAVEDAIAELNAKNIDATVYETHRSAELQAAYYARGRTTVPPHQTVTNAESNLYSWHGFGLAVDVISKELNWSAPEEWFATVAEAFKKRGCRWGGDWKMKDLPHFQWGQCKPSPSERARELFAAGGLAAVWDAVGANEPAVAGAWQPPLPGAERTTTRT
jgi:D-alanyl-D-alanine carboxypeptidase-like protein